MRIYLIGYMGSGKSTLGRNLARHAGLHFIDLDKYIEERNCRSVPQIFALEGEESFRMKERKALEEVSEFDNVVVATGGGAPCFYDNMELMNRTGITIFLDIHPEILAKRLIISKTERPLIKGKSKKELEEFIEENLHKRRLFYEQSRIRICHPEMHPDLIIRLITESV
jgi:shikimate kinase